jgi:biopolymer transport protein ExbB
MRPSASAPRRAARLLMAALGLVAAMAAATVPTSALAWWKKEWPYRIRLDLDSTPKGLELKGDAGRSPVLVRLHSGNFNFADAAPNGSDIRIVSGDDKTPLAFHVESFDPLLGVGLVWIDAPQVKAGANQSIWLYYGAKDAAAGGDAKGTFDPDYTAVYHFDGARDAPPKDVTAYNNIAQTAPATIEDASAIGAGAQFIGAGPMIVAGSPSLATKAGGPFTFSAWVRPDELQPRAAVLARRAGADALAVGLDNGIPFVEVGGQTINAATPLTQGRWSHLAVVADGATVSLYVDGKPAGQTSAALPALSGPIALGGDLPEGGLQPLKAGMDEVRFSRVARSAAQIQLDAASQGPDARLIAFVIDEKQSGMGFGHFGVIIKSVTVDAWIVIAILSIMAAASWWVMWSKTRFVNASDRANERFLSQFRDHGEDMLAMTRLDPAEARKLRESSVLRLYQAGADEIVRRSRGPGRLVLRAEAVQVIRALMDAAYVRETQKLAKAMVLLTISISGGPFLGLLGTVVGVMITFAAIAEAGDVNVNAIAPGISAALLATVAGLGVAIPALFGYNYILTRNKAVQANMQVFVDEFITRISEQYSDQGYAQAAE